MKDLNKRRFEANFPVPDKGASALILKSAIEDNMKIMQKLEWLIRAFEYSTLPRATEDRTTAEFILKEYVTRLTRMRDAIRRHTGKQEALLVKLDPSIKPNFYPKEDDENDTN